MEYDHRRVIEICALAFKSFKKWMYLKFHAKANLSQHLDLWNHAAVLASMSCSAPTQDKSSMWHWKYLIKGEVTQTCYWLHKPLFVVSSGKGSGIFLASRIWEFCF